MRNIRFAVAIGALLGTVAGCDSPLEIGNTNDPDRERILLNPDDVESLGSSVYQQVNSATLGSIARVQTGLGTASFMNASALANNGLGPRGTLPRSQVDNGRGNAYAPENYNDFRILQQAARTASDVLARATSETFVLGGEDDIDETRLKSWTYFAYGLALGTAALVYDSAAIPRPTDGPADVPPLEGYATVMAYALEQLDSAEAYAGQEEFEIEDWILGNTFSSEQFAQVIRSHRARLRAGVARTPGERDDVDWPLVIADAVNGIEEDLLVDMSPSTGWDVAWLSSTLHFRDANWHQMPYYIIGMADTSGNYEAWLAQPRATRAPFLIRTPDTRFPSGDTRPAQNDVGGFSIGTTYFPLPDGVYFRNRLVGLDQPPAGWQTSFYDHYRFRAFASGGRNSDFPVFTKVENDMLAAEGYLRTGQTPAALPLINASRTANGLPAIVGATSPTDIVPGGNACVPQVPSSANPTTATCGSVFEAMKWEKRIETAYTSYGAWYFDSRGWGDLPEGTFLSMPVPFQELDARRLSLYNLGGVGGQQAADVSTYGFGTGNQ